MLEIWICMRACHAVCCYHGRFCCHHLYLLFFFRRTSQTIQSAAHGFIVQVKIATASSAPSPCMSLWQNAFFQDVKPQSTAPLHRASRRFPLYAAMGKFPQQWSSKVCPQADGPNAYQAQHYSHGGLFAMYRSSAFSCRFRPSTKVQWSFVFFGHLLTLLLFQIKSCCGRFPVEHFAHCCGKVDGWYYWWISPARAVGGILALHLQRRYCPSHVVLPTRTCLQLLYLVSLPQAVSWKTLHLQWKLHKQPPALAGFRAVLQQSSGRCQIAVWF